jgi:hypothetical protein
MRSERTKRMHRVVFRLVCESLPMIWGGLVMGITITFCNQIVPTKSTYIMWGLMFFGIPLFMFALGCAIWVIKERSNKK